MRSTNLEDLNPIQLEAVKHGPGPILVLAGAGSGKTRILTNRIVNLISENYCRPENILAVTFTNKAANEMRERLSRLVGQIAERIWVSTFHSACLRILRSQARKLNYASGFSIYDDQDSKSLMKSVLKELSIDEKKRGWHQSVSKLR